MAAEIALAGRRIGRPVNDHLDQLTEEELSAYQLRIQSYLFSAKKSGEERLDALRISLGKATEEIERRAGVYCDL